MLLTALYMLCVPFGFLFLVHYVIVRSSKKKNVSKVQSVTSTEVRSEQLNGNRRNSGFVDLSHYLRWLCCLEG